MELLIVREKWNSFKGLKALPGPCVPLPHDRASPPRAGLSSTPSDRSGRLADASSVVSSHRPSVSGANVLMQWGH